MIDWTDMLSDVSKVFQEKHCLVSEVSQRVDDPKEKFAHMKTQRGKHLRRYKRQCNEPTFRGITITRDVRRFQNEENYVASVNKDIDDLLSGSIIFLDERFSKQLSEQPHSLFSVLNFHLWPSKDIQPEEFRCLGDDKIEGLVTMFSPLLSEEENENALDQWLDLKLIVNRIKNTTLSLLQTYQTILGFDKKSEDYERLQHILPIVEIMLTVSPSTAECERGFSCMNRVKTQGRTSMSQTTLQNLMRISVDGSNIKDFSATKSVVHWMNCGKGRRHIRGHKLTCPTGPRSIRISDSDDSLSDE